jgi:hypothetical protein
MGIMRIVLVSGAATTIVVAAANVADSYANHLYTDAVQASLNGVGVCEPGEGIPPFLLLVLAFLLLLSGIVHTALMYIRLGVMTIMLGTLPLAAAASMTDWGAGWWRKHIGWMVAWLLYKPAVALVLSAGQAMIHAGEGETDAGAEPINTRIAGIGVMLLSAIALPALLKLIVPAAAAMGTGNPMASMGQAGSSLASGAVRLGGSSSGGGAQVGPRGASGAAGSGGSSGSGGSAGANGKTSPTGSAGANSAAGAGARAGAVGGGGAAAAAAGGPVGAAAAVAVTAAQTASSMVSGAVEGADGELGHNK